MRFSLNDSRWVHDECFKNKSIILFWNIRIDFHLLYSLPNESVEVERHIKFLFSYEHEKSREVIEKFRIHISWKNIEPRRISWIFEAKVISQSHTLTCNRKHTLTQNNYEKWLIAPAQNDFSLFIFCFAHGKTLLLSNHIFILIVQIEKDS